MDLLIRKPYTGVTFIKDSLFPNGKGYFVILDAEAMFEKEKSSPYF